MPFSSSTMNANPIASPRSGDETSGTRTLPAKLAHWTASAPDDAQAAPIRPPMRAWLLELGMASAQVMRFQVIAPSSAAARTMAPSLRIIWSWTMPEPIVPATAVPKTSAPRKFAVADSRIAYSGLSARVDTEVAIAFAVSWKPLM